MTLCIYKSRIIRQKYKVKEGERMEQNVDFMIEGYQKLNFFGHEVWITTTHVCMFIVCAALVILGIAVNYKIRHAKEVPGILQNIAADICRASLTILSRTICSGTGASMPTIF